MTEYREGQTATHPKTGAKVVYKGGQWVAMTSGGATSAPPAKAAALDALSRQAQTVRQLYQKDFAGTGPLKSLGEMLPSQAAARFNSAAAGLSDQALSAFRVPGVGSQSDRELAAFIDANQPSNTDFDGAIEQKLSNIEGRLIPQRRAYGLPDMAPPLAPRLPARPAAPKPKAKPRVIDFNSLPE